MKTPTTQEAKDLIRWLYSTETQYDESLETGRKRVAAEKALLAWAKKPLDNSRYNPLRSGNTEQGHPNYVNLPAE